MYIVIIFSHVIYLCQRFRIRNCLTLLTHYIERVTFDAKPNRFYLLLYIIYVDQGLTLLQSINNISLNYSRQCALRSFINKCQEKPEKLKFYCRRYIRNELSVGIHCKLDELQLNNHLKKDILISELNFITNNQLRVFIS